MTPARVPALLAGFLAALLLTACGIPPSGVIEAGEPATHMPPPLNVYFLAGDGLLRVPRQTSGGFDVAMAVRLVFAGPTHAEARKRIRTELPRLLKPLQVTTDGSMVRVHLIEEAAPLSVLARQQLVCTVAEAQYSQPSTWRSTGSSAAGRRKVSPGPGHLGLTVSVSGPTWEVLLGSGSCPLFAS